MEFNPSRCHMLRVTLKHKPVEASYTIHGLTLELVESAKYLGVTIDSKLNFNNHIDSVAKKANGTRAFMNRVISDPAVSASETQPTKHTSDRWLHMFIPSGILTLAETSINWSKFNVTQLAMSPATTTTPAASLQWYMTLNGQHWSSVAITAA